MGGGLWIRGFGVLSVPYACLCCAGWWHGGLHAIAGAAVDYGKYMPTLFGSGYAWWYVVKLFNATV